MARHRAHFLKAARLQTHNKPRTEWPSHLGRTVSTLATFLNCIQPFGVTSKSLSMCRSDTNSFCASATCLWVSVNLCLSVRQRYELSVQQQPHDPSLLFVGLRSVCSASMAPCPVCRSSAVPRFKCLLCGRITLKSRTSSSQPPAKPTVGFCLAAAARRFCNNTYISSHSSSIFVLQPKKCTAYDYAHAPSPYGRTASEKPRSTTQERHRKPCSSKSRRRKERKRATAT